jgi:hypothetical protein
MITWMSGMLELVPCLISSKCYAAQLCEVHGQVFRLWHLIEILARGLEYEFSINTLYLISSATTYRL